MRVFSIGTRSIWASPSLRHLQRTARTIAVRENPFHRFDQPSMSGGPAVLNNGRVVGVNVATAGNQVSFLVPANMCAICWPRAWRQAADPAAAQARLRDQLIANQAAYMTQIMSAPFMTSQLGQYQVPGRLAGFMKCWGDSQQLPENRLTKPCKSVRRKMTCMYPAPRPPASCTFSINGWPESNSTASVFSTCIKRNSTPLSRPESDARGCHQIQLPHRFRQKQWR